MRFAQFMESVSYTAVILDEQSVRALLQSLAPILENLDWEIVAHHVTINMKSLDVKLNDPKILGQTILMKATTLGIDELVCAVGVEMDVNSDRFKHITVAVNRKEGGRPMLSKAITNWRPLSEYGIRDINLSGVVQEVNN